MEGIKKTWRRSKKNRKIERKRKRKRKRKNEDKCGETAASRGQIKLIIGLKRSSFYLDRNNI